MATMFDYAGHRDFGIFQTADTPDDVGGDVRARLAEIVPECRSFKTLNLTTDMEEGVVRYWADRYTIKNFVEYKKFGGSAWLPDDPNDPGVYRELTRPSLPSR